MPLKFVQMLIDFMQEIQKKQAEPDENNALLKQIVFELYQCKYIYFLNECEKKINFKCIVLMLKGSIKAHMSIKVFESSFSHRKTSHNFSFSSYTISSLSDADSSDSKHCERIYVEINENPDCNSWKKVTKLICLFRTNSIYYKKFHIQRLL